MSTKIPDAYIIEEVEKQNKEHKEANIPLYLPIPLPQEKDQTNKYPDPVVIEF